MSLKIIDFKKLDLKKKRNAEFTQKNPFLQLQSICFPIASKMVSRVNQQAPAMSGDRSSTKTHKAPNLKSWKGLCQQHSFHASNETPSCSKKCFVLTKKRAGQIRLFTVYLSKALLQILIFAIFFAFGR